MEAFQTSGLPVTLGNPAGDQAKTDFGTLVALNYLLPFALEGSRSPSSPPTTIQGLGGECTGQIPRTELQRVEDERESPE